MCQEWFTLGGVILGGLISSGTSYGLYLLQTKRDKETRVSNLKQETYMELGKNICSLMDDNLSIDDIQNNFANFYKDYDFMNKVSIYASKEVINEYLNLSKLLKGRKNFESDNHFEQAIMLQSKNILKCIRLELGIDTEKETKSNKHY